MSITDTIGAIVEGLVSGITGLGTGIAGGVKSFVTGLLFDGTGSTATLSSFMVFVVVAASIALAVGLTTLIFNWIKNLGA